MVDRLQAQGIRTAAEAVDGCLDLMGPLEVTSESREELIGFVGEGGGVRLGYR